MARLGRGQPRNVVLVRNTPGVPAQVTGLTLSGRPKRLALSWTAPADGGSAITDYVIERAPDVAGVPGTWATVTDGVSTAVTYTDTGLTNGTTYWYRVSAVNALGTGPASTETSGAPAAHPWIEASNTQGGTDLSSAANLTNPSGSTTGDLVIWFLSSDNTGGTAVTASTGWTTITNTSQMIGTNVHVSIGFARVLDGSGDDTLNPNGAAQDYTAIGIRIPSTDHSITNASINTDITAAGTFSNSVGQIDPPNLNPAVSKDWLWLAYGVIDKGITADNISADPTNFTLVAQVDSAAAASASYARLAYRRTTASSQDPGTFTNSSRTWIGLTVAVPPSAGLTALVVVATETDEAVALGRNKARALGVAAETSTAQSLGRVHSATVGVAVETDTAIALSATTKARLLGVAGETDTAVTLTGGRVLIVGAAVETDEARALTRVKARALGVAVETDAAVASVRDKALVLGPAVETDEARALTRAKAKLLGAAVETDEAPAVAGGNVRAVTPAAETDLAVALGRAKARALGIAPETDVAGPLAAATARQVQPAVETDSAGLLGALKALAVGVALETDLAVALGAAHVRLIGVALEVDTARQIVGPPTVTFTGPRLTVRVDGLRLTFRVDSPRAVARLDPPRTTRRIR